VSKRQYVGVGARAHSFPYEEIEGKRTVEMNPDVIRLPDHTLVNPVGVSTGAVVGIALAAAGLIGLYWYMNKPKAAEEAGAPAPGAGAKIPKELSFAAAQLVDIAPSGMPIKVNVGDTITIEPAPMGVKSSTFNGFAPDMPGVLISVGAADRGWKFKAALAGEEFVIIKGDDGKPYAAKVEVSA